MDDKMPQIKASYVHFKKQRVEKQKQKRLFF